VGQLQETRAILSLAYQKVRITILLVDTGIPATVEQIDAMMVAERPPPRRPELLSEVTTAVPELRLIDSLEAEADPATIDVLRFSVEEIIAIAGVENLSLAWDADDEEPDEPDEPRPTSSLYASSGGEDEAKPDDDDDTPLAAALRKAGLK